jgi:pantothenate kinase
MLDYENPDVIVWLGIWVLNQRNHQYVSDIAAFGVIIGGHRNV